MNDCIHETVLMFSEVADDTPPWACVQCHEKFVPFSVIEQMTTDFQRQMDLAIGVATDTATRIMSGVLVALGKGPEEVLDDPKTQPKNPDYFFFGDETAKYPE